MCCRFYTEPADPQIHAFLEQVNRSPLADRFRRSSVQPVPASGEINPSAVVPVIALSRGWKRSVFPMKWGFSMNGASGKGAGKLLINARSESAAEKPMFRESWAKRRCVIPASWYFEWEHQVLGNGKKKAGQKYAIRPRGQKVTWLAGLYRMEGEFPVFTILTRDPSEDVRWMHDRMPLMLPESDINAWISPDEDPESVSRAAVLALAFEKA
ncbi:MAG: SOS response-associated peptidase [Clostridia bacterium]|nr:SOS response-associated peptidase [Clostridia bacterium]